MGCALSKNSAPAGRTQGDTKAVDLASKPDEPKRPGARDHVRFDELAIKQDKPKRPGASNVERQRQGMPIMALYCGRQLPPGVPRYFDDVAELYTIPRASLISYISRLAGVLYGPGRSFPTSFVVYRALGKSQCADRDTVDQDSKDHDTLVRELSILLGVELPDKKPAADSV